MVKFRWSVALFDTRQAHSLAGPVVPIMAVPIVKECYQQLEVSHNIRIGQGM